ncbi:MAG: ATP-dependent zinc protease [Sphingomonadaceae bacterium]
MKEDKKPLTLIGRREMVDLPDLDLLDVAAKIDTGAKTSSIHARETDHFVKDGQDWVRFLFDHHEGEEPQECVMPLVGWRKITSSNGHAQERLIVRMRLNIAGQSFVTHFSLADRMKMRYPILVGRRAMRHRFQVDPGRSWLQSPR